MAQNCVSVSARIITGKLRLSTADVPGSMEGGWHSGLPQNGVLISGLHQHIFCASLGEFKRLLVRVNPYSP
jgi:hypothetical protein